ncbi:L-aspartate oxidase [Frondihabitans cladoniiphilus]|uniref:L-aspartate oxidase n=1 Tax=Frondihabitans cladoniiphilus TaxID=715785 RepID=A0ABP8W6W5_9MICO
MTQIVVVGSGLGGLTAALRATALGHAVTLVTKGAVDESNSRYAQGGIAAAVFDDDSPSLHVADTLVAGAGLSVAEAVEVLCSDGAARIDDLVGWGVQFDLDSHGRWSRGLEAAHSRSRVLHAGGDATGAAIVRALIARLETSDVTVVEHAFLTDLLLAPGATEAEANRVVGLELLVGGVRTRIPADAVVLATGGAGQLYEYTTNPLVATGDGLAAAWRAGARVDDLEFYQFHPTALAVPGSFLVSEAVRGEGAVLVDSAGKRFMPAVDRRAELAPRDIVARGIADLMSRQAGLPAFLDATGIGAATLVSRFPTITAATRAAGLDWTREPIPVTPAAHYFMGGVATDLDGRTTLPGLYAVGEVASTGVHGANRLASNSLLEALVFGWRVVDAVAWDARSGALDGAADVSDAVVPLASTTVSAAAGAGAAAVADATPAVSSTGASGVPLGRPELQRLMWAAAGVERSGDRLAEAAARLADATVAGTGSCGADSTGDSTGDTAAAVASSAADTAAADTAAAAEVQDLETANLIDVARLVVAGALAREESRGAHYRTDFPTPHDEPARTISWAREVPQNAHR